MRNFTTENWGYAPYNRQSFQQVQSLFPTARLRRGASGPSDLPLRHQDITQIEYDSADGTKKTVADFLATSYNDAFLVAKDGALIAEHYDNGMDADSLHLINSISKSFLGMLAGILAGQGLIDPERKVSDYIPEFSTNAFSETTVRQVLDMTAAVKFSEDYDIPDDDFWVETSVIGWRPALVKPGAPQTLFDYALSRSETVQADGAVFRYRTLLTNVLGMVIERAAGRPLQDLMEEELIQKLGFEQDCTVVVDRQGFPYFGAGMSVCARDLARFGLMLMNNGVVGGQQVVPASWVAETLAGDDLLRTSFAASVYAEGLPGGHYRNQCWGHKDLGLILCIGIHGQTIVCNPANGVVAVKLTSHPQPAPTDFYGEVFTASLTIAASV